MNEIQGIKERVGWRVQNHCLNIEFINVVDSFKGSDENPFLY